LKAIPTQTLHQTTRQLHKIERQLQINPNPKSKTFIPGIMLSKSQMA